MHQRWHFWVATLAYVVGTGAESTYYYFLVPSWATQNGAEDAMGIAFPLSALITMFLALPGGWAGDRFGRGRVMAAGFALTTAGSLVFFLPDAPPFIVIIAATALLASGFVLAYVAFSAYMGDLLRGEELTKALGLTSSLSLVVSGLAPFAGAALIVMADDPIQGIAWSAAMLAGFAAFALVLSLVLPRVRRAAATPEAGAEGGAEDPLASVEHAATAFSLGLPNVNIRTRADARGEAGPRSKAGRRRVLRVGVAFALMGVSAGMASPYLSIYFLDLVGSGEAAWGAILGASTLAGAAGYAAAALAATRLRAATILIGTNVLHVVAALPLLFALEIVYLGLAAVLSGFFWYLSQPVLTGMAADAATEADRGRAIGLTMLTYNLGWAGGAAVGMPILDATGAWLFVISAVLAFGAVFAVLQEQRGRRRLRSRDLRGLEELAAR